MFNTKTTTSDLLERLRLSDPKPSFSAGEMVKDEVNALARTARRHPAGSGSLLALVGAVAFGLGFLAAQAGKETPPARKRIFRARSKRWPARTTHAARSSFFSGRR